MSNVHIEYMPLTELLERRRTDNPKLHAIDEVGQSIARFGWVGSVLLDDETAGGTGDLLAGHGRLRALSERKAKGGSLPARINERDGEWYVPVTRGVRFNSPEEATAYLLADNQLTIKGGYDREALTALVERSLEDSGTLEGTGFSAADLDGLKHDADFSFGTLLHQLAVDEREDQEDNSSPHNDEEEEEDDELDLTNVQPHLTALSRASLSRPMSYIRMFGWLSGRCTVFDYGCGKGDDLGHLEEMLVEASGWDPHYRPEAELVEADVVNLGYVLNVIPDAQVRTEALRRAWSLTRLVMVASVMTRPKTEEVTTERNTFQRYFAPDDFEGWLKEVTGEEPVRLEPGIAAVFKSKHQREEFLTRRGELEQAWGVVETLTLDLGPGSRQQLLNRIRTTPGVATGGELIQHLLRLSQ